VFGCESRLPILLATFALDNVALKSRKVERFSEGENRTIFLPALMTGKKKGGLF